MRTQTIVMAAFAAVFGLLAVFLSQLWLNNQAERLRALEAQGQTPSATRTIVVARRALRFGDDLSALSLRELPWPSNALPDGAFSKISDLTSEKRVVLTPINANEAVLASKVTGPGQRATLSAILANGMKAVTIRVNDVDGVAGFVLPGDHVDVLLTRVGDKNAGANDLVMQNAKVLAIDQVADEQTDKPSVVKAVTLEVGVTDGQKISLAAKVGALSLLLRKAGDAVGDDSRRVTLADLGVPAAPSIDRHLATVTIMHGITRQDYDVPIGDPSVQSSAPSEPAPRSAETHRAMR